MRLVPEVRALYGRVRRPARQLLVAALLIVPATSFIVARSGQPPESNETVALAVAAGVDADAHTDRPDLREKLNEALSLESDVARAWRERALEREARQVSHHFTHRYRAYRLTPELATEIHVAARLADIDPEIAFGLVRVESAFRRNAVSHAGAVGYAQVLPSTARWMVPGTSRRDLFDTQTNLRIGFQYLRYLLDKYDDDMFLALTAYNRGPGTVNRLLSRGRNPDNGYARKVLRG